MPTPTGHLLRRASVALVVASALPACGHPIAPAAPREGPPNVLWITIDTLRARDLEAYGCELPTSPSLLRLAEKGVVVEHAFAQAPWTKPSVASMLTSLRPHVHGATSESTQSRLAEPLVTIAEVLRGRGYQTAAFSENPHVHRATAFDQGFEHFAARADWQADALTIEATIGEAIEWIDGRDPAAPFFCYVQILDPHGPYQPPAAARDLFVEGVQPEDVDVARGNVDAFQKNGAMVKPLAGADLLHMKRLYDAELRSVDDALGRLLELIDGAGLTDETLILVTSDHGEEFAEHGGFLHGYQLFDETIHVPVLLRGPGLPPGRLRDVLVEHIDLAPTILDLVGLPAPPEWQGASFAAALEDRRTRPAPDHEEILTETSFRGRSLRGLRLRDWKLIHDLAADSYRLYDLADDPGEQIDVIDRHPDVAARLKARMEEIVADAPSVDRAGAWGEGDAELQEMLSRIGYVDDAAD